MNTEQLVKRSKVGKVLNIIFNIVFMPVIIFVAIFTFSLFISKATTGVPTVFGYTQIQLISGSMQDAGFYMNEKYFVHSTNTDSLQVGDRIAFFQYSDPNCPSPSNVTQQNTPRKRAQNSRIVFHEIYEIQVDRNGNRWFVTKGTNNLTPDSEIIYENYVIGKHVAQENFWTKLITFITSKIGIIVLVALPCTVVIAVDLYQLIMLCYQYNAVKKASDAEMELLYKYNISPNDDKKKDDKSLKNESDKK